MIKDEIIIALQQVTGSEDIKLDMPSNKDHGDYATSVAITLAKRQKKNPLELARELVSKLENDSELRRVVSKIEVADPGFINFRVSDEALVDNILHPLTPSSKLEEGQGGVLSGERKAVVEYSSPNIAKPFGIGHFRSTIIGDAVANLLEATGWKVYRDNHLGDWGTQFGKLIYKLKSVNRENLTIKDLVDLYVEFHKEAEQDPTLEDKAREEFKKLEEGEPENRKIWQFCVDVSLKEFKRVYDVLGIKFTENDGLGYGESYFEHMIKPVIDELQEKGLLKSGEDDAKLVFFPDDKYPPLMIVKKDGTTLYATRDLATDKFRLDKYGRDVVIVNEVGAEQSLYFEQLFELEKMLGWVKEDQRVHIKHGFFRFVDRKMSTRKGDIIWLDDVIAQAIEKARKFGSDEKLSKTVAVGALKWNELKRDPIKDIVFDWDEILSMDGNSGPYLQYTYARTASILSKVVPEKQSISEPFDEKEKSVARVLIHFPEIVQSAAINYSPHVLANYLFSLAQEFNSFYNAERVLGHEREEARLLLTEAVGNVIKKGLDLLGIEAPEKM
ncbi:arginine--tRNA ligase [Candidatus Woesebacteria bacterium RIFCSPHIGHO2_01_FULL_44_21]|uniref:Arginine--tRNA ligase n=1 Tax=Candidatus Woesebacteria bacterium RIFCSPHIGHO2_01_FULL_44_21 TaxID=1802503 RepID=A0A1F7Z1Q1_9BACT|nr:MAG: arginine--tRNA ligase [Candidatus Woesebacteria bacterium RIFCSPHIGHO2_01_FULL_44_21]OGM70005.1 MAG: arginine--tRNA ligase [Candidatus Woesebacteria bacterium RIFCSPLOWO2_01_FULL_44_24b]